MGGGGGKRGGAVDNGGEWGEEAQAEVKRRRQEGRQAIGMLPEVGLGDHLAEEKDQGGEEHRRVPLAALSEEEKKASRRRRHPMRMTRRGIMPCTPVAGAGRTRRRSPRRALPGDPRGS